MALTVSQDGSIWAGSRYSGVHRLAAGSKRWQKFDTQDGLQNNQIRRLFISKNDTLWVGSIHGVSRWNPISKKFDNFTDPQGAPMESYVTSFAEDLQGNLWIGSENGLWVLETGAKTLKNIRHQHDNKTSLISDQVSGLLVDHLNRLWIDTDHGLDRLISWDGNLAKFEHMNELAGKPGVYLGANLLEDQNGKIWTQWHIYDPKNYI